MANKSVKYEIDALSKKAEQSVKNLTGEINKSVNALQKQNNTTKKSGQTFSVFLGNLAANATSALTSEITSLGRQVLSLGLESITSASNIEDLEVQFKTLTGSASQARQIMGNLTEFAAQTPFQLEGLAKVSSQLLSFGFEVDQLQPKLKRIGDVAAASNTPIQDLGLIFGQVSAAGKLTGERLLQLQERGIPILGALAKQLNTNQAAVRNMVTQGKVDFATFEEAFNSLSEEGGFAFDGMIAKSQTLTGLISTLGDNWTLRLAEIGKAFLPLTKTLTKIGIDILRTFDTKPIIEWIRNGLIIGIDALKTFANNLNPIIAGFQTLWNIGQIVFRGFEAGIQTIALGFSELIAGAINQVIKLIDVLPDSLVPDTWKESLESAKSFLDSFSDQASSKLSETSDAIVQDIDDIAKAWTENAFSEDTINVIQTRLDQIKDSVLETNQVIEDDTNEKRENREIAAQEDEATFFAREEERLTFIRNILGQEEALRNEQRIRELIAKGDFNTAQRKVDEAYLKARRADIFTVQKWEELSQRQRISNLKSTLGQVAQLQSSGSKELFFIGKAAAVATATIDGIAATQKALASAPPPINFALAALVGAASAINIAKIASAAPPSFQDGGIVPGNNFTGDNVLARVNSGEMILNRQQQQNLFQLANARSAGAGQEIMINTTVMLDDEVVGNVVSRQVANGLQLGEVV